MKNIFAYCTLILCTVFNACTIDEIEVFGNDAFAYLDIDDNEGKLIDENGYLKQQFTFALVIDQSLTEVIQTFPVTIAGIPTEAERNFSVEITDSLTTAVEGVHFDLLPESENKIFAGEAAGVLPVKLYKTEDLDTKVYKIALNIVDNNVVKAGPKGKLILSISNILLQPEWWPEVSDYAPSIGEFSQTKARLWMVFHDLLDGSDPWQREPYAVWTYNDYDGQYYWREVLSTRYESVRLFALWLAEGDENGNPWVDENGREVLSTF